MENETDYVLLGRIIGVHGVRGMVKIHSECRPREQIFQYRQLCLKNEQTGHTLEVTLQSGRAQGKGLIAHFAGFDDRDQAYALNNHTMWVHREQLPALATDEFYWHDLIGMQVSNLADETLGIVESLIETGANDVLVIKNDEQTLLIPFIMQHYIINIDLTAQHMQVDWHKDWSDTN